jgi:hypothetical protein
MMVMGAMDAVMGTMDDVMGVMDDVMGAMDDVMGAMWAWMMLWWLNQVDGRHVAPSLSIQPTFEPLDTNAVRAVSCHIPSIENTYSSAFVSRGSKRLPLQATGICSNSEHRQRPKSNCIHFFQAQRGR